MNTLSGQGGEITAPKINLTVIPDVAGGQDSFLDSDEVLQDERRMHLRAFDYWRNSRIDGDLPDIKSLSRDGLDPFRDYSIMLELDGKPTVRFMGHALAAEAGQRVPPGTLLEALPDHCLACRIQQSIEAAVDRRRPVELAATCRYDSGEAIKYRGVLLPLGTKSSVGGSNVAFIYAVLTWRPATPMEALELDAPLTAMLRKAREAASQVVHIDGRSRQTLYDALAGALGFYEESLLAANDYQHILEEMQLKVQARAPFTPILKLIFGKEYDKTRLTEYAAALSYAWRNGQTRSSFKSFVTAHPGGIKGCVKAERRERRIAGGNREKDQIEAAKEVLRNRDPLDMAAIGSQVQHEYCLLIARKNTAGITEAVALAEESEAMLESALKRAAKSLKLKTDPLESE